MWPSVLAAGFAPIRVISATVRNGDVMGDLVGDPTGGVFDRIFLKVVVAGAVKVVGETKEHVNAGALNIRIHHRNDCGSQEVTRINQGRPVTRCAVMGLPLLSRNAHLMK